LVLVPLALPLAMMLSRSEMHLLVPPLALSY
jgi:hypothetical protein